MEDRSRSGSQQRRRKISSRTPSRSGRNHAKIQSQPLLGGFGTIQQFCLGRQRLRSMEPFILPSLDDAFLISRPSSPARLSDYYPYENPRGHFAFEVSTNPDGDDLMGASRFIPRPVEHLHFEQQPLNRHKVSSSDTMGSGNIGLASEDYVPLDPDMLSLTGAVRNGFWRCTSTSDVSTPTPGCTPTSQPEVYNGADYFSRV